jgi:L-ascorbate metabolism protein UlaG (beta-lactamase superfamily)
VEPGLSPAEFENVELILISHEHRDHLHRETLARLPRSATVVLPPRTARHVSDLGFARVLEIAPGQSVEHRGVAVYSQAVRHECSAPVLSYVIRGDGPSVYFCGDSGYFSGFAEIGRRFRPDIALLPIGGYHPAPFRERHMSPLDALYAFEDLCARVMIPHHYGAFPLSYERLEDPADWLAKLVAERALAAYVLPLAPGESRVFARPETDTLGRGRSRPAQGGESPFVVASPDSAPGSRAVV